MPSKDYQNSRWDEAFRPFINKQSSSPPSYEEVSAQVSLLQQQVAELSAVTRQLQAMIYEMWSGERSEVIITPPSAPRSDDILRLDS